MIAWKGWEIVKKKRNGILQTQTAKMKNLLFAVSGCLSSFRTQLFNNLTMIIWTYWPHNKRIHRFSLSVHYLRIVPVVVFEEEIGHHTHRLSQHHEQSLTQDVRQQIK